ncbi:MAG: glycosyltransferase family 4 protein [Bacteroidota bacterium]
MKILLLCKKFPYPLKDGESIAIHALSKALSDLGCELSMLAMNTSKHYYPARQLPAEMKHFQQIRTVDIDNRIKLVPAFLNLFSEQSYHIERFVSAPFERALQQMLQAEEYDIIQLETLYLAPYIPTIRRYSKALVSMRAHNVEHEIWERISSHTGNSLKRWYLQHLTAKLRRFEIDSLPQYDVVLPITRRDANYFRDMGSEQPAVVTPIGIRTEVFQDVEPILHPHPSMSFIGSLDWMPNLEGLDWFIAKCWPAIHEAFPALQFHVAGRNTPAHLLKLNTPQVTIHGEVPESIPFVNAHNLMVVPLLSGSGMRAKILEGMALGKVVITTSIGLEGIDARHKEHVLIANTPDQFQEALRYVLRSRKHLARISEQARQFAFTQYDSLVIAKRLRAAYADCLVETY